jgi:hypothetical protein
MSNRIKMKLTSVRSPGFASQPYTLALSLTASLIIHTLKTVITTFIIKKVILTTEHKYRKVDINSWFHCPEITSNIF